MNIARGIVVAILTCLGCTILFTILGSYESLEWRSMLGIGFIGFLIGLAILLCVGAYFGVSAYRQML